MHATPLRGHHGPVLGLSAHPTEPRRLLSHSEDGTCRVWESSSRRATRCIVAGTQPVSAATFLGPDGGLVAVVLGSTLALYDLRRPDFILRSADTSLLLGLGPDEEVNHLAAHGDGTLCCAADDGALYLVGTAAKDTDAGDLRLLETLPLHDNVCAVAKYRQRAGNKEIVSGGYDCCMFHFDADSSTMLNSLNVSSVPSHGRLVNPPFVHCLDVDPKGDNAALGLGDGRLLFCSLGEGDLWLDLAAHCSAISAVRWLPGDGGARVWTAGADGCGLWDLHAASQDGDHGHEVIAPLIHIAHPVPVNDVLPAPSGPGLCVADTDGLVTRYDLPA